MSFELSGYNAFYEGWLARILGLPKTSIDDDWILGWETADETGDAMYIAFGEEIKRKLEHIIVEEI